MLIRASKIFYIAKILETPGGCGNLDVEEDVGILTGSS
jgi:hypothetical protein